MKPPGTDIAPINASMSGPIESELRGVSLGRRRHGPFLPNSEIVMRLADASNPLDPWIGEARGGEIGLEHRRGRSPRFDPSGLRSSTL